MRRSRKKFVQEEQVIINEGIRSDEVRLIIEGEGNLGVMKTKAAIAMAHERGHDLILITENAVPPIAKIMDYGEFQYQKKRKQREIRAKARAAKVEIKNIQVTIGTGQKDMQVKANKVANWMKEGDRVKTELYLRGRSKYMERSFLEERLNRFLEIIPAPFTMVDEIKKSPKGISCILELDKKKFTQMEKEAAEKKVAETEETKEETPTEE